MTLTVLHVSLRRAEAPEVNAVMSIPADHTIDNGAGEPLRRKWFDICSIADARHPPATLQHVARQVSEIAVSDVIAVHVWN